MATASLKRALSAFPDAKVRTKAAWVESRTANIKIILNLLCRPGAPSRRGSTVPGRGRFTDASPSLLSELGRVFPQRSSRT